MHLRKYYKINVGLNLLFRKKNLVTITGYKKFNKVKKKYKNEVNIYKFNYKVLIKMGKIRGVRDKAFVLYFCKHFLNDKKFKNISSLKKWYLKFDEFSPIVVYKCFNNTPNEKNYIHAYIKKNKNKFCYKKRNSIERIKSKIFEGILVITKKEMLIKYPIKLRYISKPNV